MRKRNHDTLVLIALCWPQGRPKCDILGSGSLYYDIFFVWCCVDNNGPSLPVNPAGLAIGSKCGFQSEFVHVEVIKKLQGDFILVRHFDLGGHMTLSAACLRSSF